MVPRYIDELKEINLAYQIYLGRVYPLHNMAHEIGALHNYILAGIFKLFGPSIYWPRLYVALTSAATVVLLYYLGWKMDHRWTGVIAAGLLLTNGMHILVTHMAWANCTTPFFFALALFAIVKAEELRNGYWLIGAGFLWALALQTHSSVIIYVLITFFYVLKPAFRRKTGIPLKYYWGGLFTFSAGYSNMIIYNLLTRGESIRWIFTKDYTLENKPGLYSYCHNLNQMFCELIRSISSTYSAYNNIRDYLGQPHFLLAVIFLSAGIYWAIKEKKTLPVLFLAGGFIVIPWINRRFGFYIVTRYIMPLIICSLLLMALGLSRTLRKIASRFERPRLFRISAAGLFLIVVGMQIWPFYGYCSRLARTDMSNYLSLKLVEKVGEFNPGKETKILIDAGVAIENDPLPVLFAIRRYDFAVINKDQDSSVKKLAAEIRGVKTRLALIGILSPKSYRQLKQTALRMEKVDIFSCRGLLNKQPPLMTHRVYLVKIVVNRS